MKSRQSELNFELLNNAEDIKSLAPTLNKKAKLYFILIGFGIGSIISFITLLLEHLAQGVPLLPAVLDAINISHLLIPVLMGGLGMLAGNIYDNRIAEEKTIYHAFYNSQQTLELVTDNLPSAISYFGSDLNFRFANKTYANWLKFPQNKFYKTPIKEVVGIQIFNEVLPKIKIALNGQTVSYESVRRYKGTPFMYVNISLIPHFSETENVEGVFVLINNITKLKKRERKIEEQKLELKKINKTKDRLFSIIAHDLKNPLNAIIGFSQNLYEEAGSFNSKETSEISFIIYQQSKQLFNLLSNLLDWSQNQFLDIKPKPEKIRLSVVINDILGIISITVNAKKITIREETDGEISVYADKIMLHSILRNLLINAIKYTPEDGIVVVKTEKTQGSAQISVIDTGVGMSKLQLNNLFNQEKTKTTIGTNNESGTGIGLIICKDFVEKNGGKITVTSEEGRGSCFSFTLPVVN